MVAYVLRSSLPSNRVDRTAGRRGCRCSGRTGRLWACRSWSSFLRSSSRCRWNGRSSVALSACCSTRPETTGFLRPTASARRRSRSIPHSSCLKEKKRRTVRVRTPDKKLDHSMIYVTMIQSLHTNSNTFFFMPNSLMQLFALQKPLTTMAVIKGECRLKCPSCKMKHSQAFSCLPKV